MASSAAAPITVVLLTSLLGACAPGLPEAATPVAGPLATAEEGGVPTLLRTTWNSGTPGRSWVEYSRDGELATATPWQETVDGDNDILVAGLKAGERYTLVGATETADGQVVYTEPMEIEVASRPAGLPAFELTVEAGEAATPGFVLASVLQADGSWLVMLDRDGDYVWWHEIGAGYLAPTVKRAANGRDLLYAVFDQKQIRDIAELRRLSLLDGVTNTTRLPMGHHDFAELPGGEIAWLAYDTRSLRVDGELALVTGDAVRAVPEGSDGRVADRVLFSTLVDGMDLRSTCDHQHRVIEGTGGLDWSHGNSLVYSEAGDSLYFMARHLDTLHVIDAAGGGLLGRYRPDRSDPDGGLAAVWSHPHFSDVGEGHLVVFDNGVHRNQPVSGIARYGLEGVGGQPSFEWRYESPEGVFIEALGDARLLPDGNYLTSWLTTGVIAEISPEDGVVWQVETDIGSAVARILWIDDLYALVDDAPAE